MQGEDNGRHRRTTQTSPGNTTQGTYRTNVGTSPSPLRAFYPSTDTWVPLEDAGIRAGEIIGYRAWLLYGNNLFSVYANYRWSPEGEATPVENLHFYGLHAFKTYREAYYNYRCYQCGDTVIFGSVALWGEVIEHKIGYRAQYARIISLDKLLNNCKGSRSYKTRKWQFWREDKLAELRKIYIK
jgi:hypothetical protein